jgi:CheY-like chemotaxis protein
MQRILVIEDDPAIRAAVELILDHEGYSVALAPDGDAGLDLVRSAAFDLVIVDIFMPGRGGLETIGLIRQHAPNLPVVATSGLSARGDGSRSADDVLGQAISLGAACVLHKPFRPRDLLQTVERCLNGGA